MSRPDSVKRYFRAMNTLQKSKIIGKATTAKTGCKFSPTNAYEGLYTKTSRTKWPTKNYGRKLTRSLCYSNYGKENEIRLDTGQEEINKQYSGHCKAEEEGGP